MLSTDPNAEPAGNDPPNESQVIDLVKNLISLPGYTHALWRETHQKSLQDFLNGPGRKILLIYFESDQLIIDTQPPRMSPTAMMYFVTDLSEKDTITPKTFNEKVHFGSVSGNILKCLLNQLEAVFLPALNSYGKWHRSIRTDFLNQFQKFMAGLTVHLTSLIIGYGISSGRKDRSLCPKRSLHRHWKRCTG
jgi:hypothetical protein